MSLFHVWQRVRGRALEEVIILNVDTNTLETPFDDLKRIPSDVVISVSLRILLTYSLRTFYKVALMGVIRQQQEVIKLCFQVSGLKVCLKRQAVSPGCGVSRAFLKAQAVLFGGYRDALQCQQVIGLYGFFEIVHGLFKIAPDTVVRSLFRMEKCYSTRSCSWNINLLVWGSFYRVLFIYSSSNR